MYLRDLLQIDQAPGITITEPLPGWKQFSDKHGNYFVTDGMKAYGEGHPGGIVGILRGLDGL